jgi:hypothetical protein
MSYSRVGQLLPKRRIKRMAERRQQNSQTMKDAPRLGKPMRVVLRLRPGSEAGEELFFLGALQELKRLHDRISLEYVTTNPQVAKLLKGNWFLKAVHCIRSQEYFEEIVGTDFSITLFDPDPQAAAIAEEDRFKTAYQSDLEAKQFLQQMYQERGMKDLVVDMPAYHFQPRWCKSNAYLWSVVDRLGLQVAIPFQPIVPYGDVPQSIRREALALAAKERIISQPFAIYDVRGEVNETVLAAVIGKALYPIRVFSMQELQKAVGDDVAMQMGVLQSPNCQFVVAPVGDFLYGAWAAGVPSIMALYQGANYSWDGVHPQNEFPLQRDQYDDDSLPQALYQGLVYLGQKANGS